MQAPWRPRRSVLFTPATRADRWTKALEGPADVAVLDLEDGVAPPDKAAARAAAAALKASRPGRVERAVRINAWPSTWATQDVEAVAEARPDLLVLPKAEVPDEVRDLVHALRVRGAQPSLLLIIETARGVVRAPELALASPRVVALAFGAEDYAASVGARRTPEGLEVLYARSRVVAAAAAAGVDAVDQVYTMIDDLAGLERETRFAAQLGYKGKMAIHPKQVEAVHKALRPTEDEVAWARRVVDATKAAGAQHGGVVVVEGRMVDRPLLLQAERVLTLHGLEG